MPKKKQGPTYSRELNKPILRTDPLVIALRKNHIGNEQERILGILIEKFGLLMAHYGIDKSAKDCWGQLALCLAFAHVPGMQVTDQAPPKKGRPPKWKGPEGFELLREIDTINQRQKASISRAIRTLQQRDPNRWGQNKYKPAELEARYYEARKAFAKLVKSLPQSS